MQRRKFLSSSIVATLTLSGIPVIGCTRESALSNRVDGTTTEPLAQEIEQLVTKLLKQHSVAGAAIALIRDGKQSWSKGFGVTESSSGKPVDADTVFECASISKTVFAYAVMKLWQSGDLDLDKPLASYGVHIESDDPRAKSVTPRHVLSHQSGLQDWRSSEGPLKFHFNPGEGFMYSGEAYFYLQSVITKLFGKTDNSRCGRFEAGLEVCSTDIGEYLQREVLQPLGMKSSSYLTTDEITINYALPHNVQGQPFKKPLQTGIDLARYASAGGLLTTVNDYATFLLSILAPVENDPSHLNRRSMDLMLTPQVKMPKDVNIDGATSWALGWAVQERKGGNVVLHSGGQPGYRSLAMLSPSMKSGFVMFTNSDNGGNIVYDLALSNILNDLLPT